MLLMALLATSCVDEIAVEDIVPEGEKNTGELVFLTSGSTENATATRANTYYMEPQSRFVCNMYFKSDDSGEMYDLDRKQTAWLKVEDWQDAAIVAQGATPGNSLYWNNSYADVSVFDKFRNDDHASIFYWQNRREHAFVAWTDLNKIKAESWTDANGLNMDFSSTNDKYTYKTGEKTTAWITKGIYVSGLDTKYADETAAITAARVDYTGNQALFTYEKQAAQTNKIIELYGSVDAVQPQYYRSHPDVGHYAKYARKHEVVDSSHQNEWTILCFFDQKLKYALPDYGEDFEVTTPKYNEDDGHQYLVDKDDVKVAERITVPGTGRSYLKQLDSDAKIAQIVTEGEVETYYQCDANGYILYDEAIVKGWICIYTSKTLEQVDEEIEVDAKKFDLRSSAATAMSAQPDILMAFTKDKIPTSAVMENNRVELVFKHQFSQVQVNLLSSTDTEDKKITEDQIESVYLLGVSDYGFIFPYLIYGQDAASGSGSEEVAMVKPSTFKEVVATDYTDAELIENPYGTRFVMYDRTLTEDDKNVKKYIKSYEGITFGRLQAIRITWHENEDGNVTHTSTFRVPETNELQQPLRLLQSGTKYIWNMELRRGTLAVIQTEIIPWVENQENYSTDGLIFKPSATNP